MGQEYGTQGKGGGRFGGGKQLAGARPGSETAHWSPQEIHQRIAAKAYALYEARGFSHGLHLEDWLEAERLVLSELKSAAPSWMKSV